LPASKKKIACPSCGKKYPASKEACPHCSERRPESEDTISKEAPKSEVKETADSGGPPSKDGGIEDLEKWLMGDDAELWDWMGGTRKEGAVETVSVSAPQKAPQKIDSGIEDWLHGKVDDISTWLMGETPPRSAAQDMIAPAFEVKAEYRDAAEEELRRKIEDLKDGKTTVEELGEELLSLLSDLQALRKANEKMRGEVDSIKKGSTALAKYFKSYQGKDENELQRIADELANEMAVREQLEIQNMELQASVETLRGKIERGLQDAPVDEQEMRKLELELEEKNKFLAERDEYLKEKEQELAAQEATSRQEIRERFTAELQEKVSEFEKGEIQLRGENEKLTIRNKELELKLRHKDEEIQLMSNGTEGGLGEALKDKLADYQRLEREMAIRDQKLQKLQDKLSIKEDELRALKEPMRYKEDELLQREEDLMHREKIMEEELKRLEQTKAELGSQDELELKKRLEELQSEITAKEEDILRKEKYLHSKEEELKLREQSVISEEIEKRDEERALEFKIEKVKTGIRRLDDLLIGGLPFGSNVLIYGPAFTGKEVLVNIFASEGLKKGVPVIWVTTEKTPNELREEMNFIISGFEEYEKLGLVKFVDSYSRSMGDDSQDPNVRYIDSPTDFQAIQQAIEDMAKELLEKHKYYRFVFRSISTMIAYLDPNTAFRFLNPIVGRRKRDKSVGMYIIEKGMHGEQEIQMVGSLMDGMVEMKVENLNTFLSIRGIGEVQSRAWIRYTATKSILNIGSFALDHIR